LHGGRAGGCEARGASELGAGVYLVLGMSQSGTAATASFASTDTLTIYLVRQKQIE